MEEENNKSILIEYVKAINYIDISLLEEFLADNFHYTSQLLENGIEGKKEYLNWLVKSLRTFECLGWSIIARISESYIKDAFDLYMINKKNDTEINRIGALRVEINKGRIMKSKLILINKKNIDLLKSISL